MLQIRLGCTIDIFFSLANPESDFTLAKQSIFKTAHLSIVKCINRLSQVNKKWQCRGVSHTIEGREVSLIITWQKEIISNKNLTEDQINEWTKQEQDFKCITIEEMLANEGEQV